MITAVNAVILGAVEGISEFLPISSTAHIILVTKLLGIPFTTFSKSFTIAIQSGAILAVVALYWRTLFNWLTIKKFIAAFIPTAIIGLAFYPYVTGPVFESIPLILTTLGLGGAFLVLFERAHSVRPPADITETINYKQAVGIGFAQSLAIIPGISRSAATVIGGMVMGVSRVAMVEFSFLLAVPTMGAATALDLYKHYGEFTSSEFISLVIGFVVAFITALFAIDWLLKYVRSHTFEAFGYYRIGLVAVVAIILFII